MTIVEHNQLQYDLNVVAAWFPWSHLKNKFFVLQLGVIFGLI